MAEKKLHALPRVFKYMNISQRKLIVNAFIMSQFSYCPLIWMSHSQAKKERINRCHEKTLRLIDPNQHQLTLKKLLKKTRPSAYTRNINKPL